MVLWLLSLIQNGSEILLPEHTMIQHNLPSSIPCKFFYISYCMIFFDIVNKAAYALSSSNLFSFRVTRMPSILYHKHLAVGECFLVLRS